MLCRVKVSMKEPLLIFKLCGSGRWRLDVHKSRQLWMERLLYFFLQVFGVGRRVSFTLDNSSTGDPTTISEEHIP